MNLAYDMIARQEDTGRFFGLILSGPAGIGKTHAAMSMVRPDDVFARIAVAGKNKDDMVTYPVPQEVDGEMIIQQAISEGAIIPLLDKNIKDKFGVLLLDDVTLADPNVQSALLELVQFGRIGEHQLGKNVLVIMTGNGIGDGAYAVPWSKPLQGRSHFIRYKANFEIWKDLPSNFNVDASVLGFLNEHKDFFAPDPTGAEAPKYFDENDVGPQPRTWSTLGTSLTEKWNGAANFKGNILFPSLEDYVASLVGTSTATAYMTFAKTLLEYPSSEELMNDYACWDSVSESKKNNRGAIYAVVQSLRQNFINKLEVASEKRGKKATEEMFDITERFLLAVASVMNKNRDVGMFAIAGTMGHLKSDDKFLDVFDKIDQMLYADEGIHPQIERSGLNKVHDDIRALKSGVSL